MVDDRPVALNLRGQRLHRRHEDRVQQGAGIRQRQGAVAALGRYRPYEEQVRSQGLNSGANLFLSSSAHRHGRYDRRDADDDAKEGQAGSQLVGSDGVQGCFDGKQWAHDAAPFAVA